jgi:hypothetical protein
MDGASYLDLVDLLQLNLLLPVEVVIVLPTDPNALA